MRGKMWSALLAALVLLLLAGPAQARHVLDMAGRRVEVSEKISRVYATAPPATYMVYAMGPDLLVGLNSPLRKPGRQFLAPRMAGLPVLGGWFGQGRMANREALLRARPQVVVSFRWRSRSVQWKIEQTLNALGLPVAGVVIDSIRDYPAALRFLGRLFGREQRGESLARYAERTLAEMARLRQSLPPGERKTVYYAEGRLGLQTECDNSFHAELIKLCGAVNPHRCVSKTIIGRDKISLEQVLAYNPQVILTQDRAFFAAVAGDPRWSGTRALADKRVYLAPNQPLNWLDRPPSFMGILGAHWLAHKLYPRRHPVDMVAKTVEFFRLFLGVKIDRATAGKILGS